MMRLMRFFPMLAMVLMLALSFSDTAYAQIGTGDSTEIKTVDEEGKRVGCSLYEDAAGGVLLGKIVPCIVHTIQDTSVTFSIAMIDMLDDLVYAFMVFAITMFGVKVLQGERQIGPQAFLMLIKIAFVLGLLHAVPEMIQIAYMVIDNGVTMTTSVLGDYGLNCDIDNYGDAATPIVWQQMDCVLGKLYGFATGTTPTGAKSVNVLLASSAIGLLTGFFFGGTLGVAVFFALLGVLWSIVMVVLRMALAFINGYLIVCVMLLIAPIFMPLAVLKITSEYFDRWVKSILGGILLPIIITAYSMFAMVLYDRALFADDSLLQHLFQNEMVGGVSIGASTDTATENSRTLCDFNVTNDPNFKAPEGTTKEDLNEIINNPFLKNFAAPLLSAANDACALFKVPVFDVSKVYADPLTGEKDEAFANGKEAMVRIFRTSIELLILAYLISAGLGTLQGVISSFTGSSLAGAAMTARSETESRITKAFGEFKSNLGQAFTKTDQDGKVSHTTGSSFLKDAPKALTKAGTDFLGGIARNKD